jgi:hypothetical protein
MVMELIRATSPLKGRFFVGVYKFSLTHTVYSFAPATYSPAPFSPINHCSLFLNNTLKVVKDP